MTAHTDMPSLLAICLCGPASLTDKLSHKTQQDPQSSFKTIEDRTRQQAVTWQRATA